MPKLTIIVPVFNEAKTFPKMMEMLYEKKIPSVEKEIIIVESNSTDGTREAVLKYKGRSEVKIILEDKPKGKGAAVRKGLAHATGDFVLIQDGDLEYDLDDYDKLLAPLISGEAAFVLGSRHLKGWKMRHFETAPFTSFMMNVGHVFFATLLNVLCGVNLKDPFTMYKVFRRDSLDGLTFKANRFDFDFELVIKLLRKGYVPREIPISYKSRSFSEGKKISIVWDPLSWIVALFRFRFGRLYEKNPQNNDSRKRIYALLFAATLIFAGGSILYMTLVARSSDAPNARLYPASGLGAGGVTFDNVVLSKNLIEHKIFSRNTEPPFEPDTWRTPGYPVFVAAFYAVTNSFYPVVIAQIFTLFLTAVLIFKMAETLMSNKWALLTSLLYIILPTTLLTTSALFNENLFVFVFVSALYIFFFSEFKNFYLKWALTGFLLAISAYIRPASFYILFFFVPAYFIFYLKRAEISRQQFVSMGLLILVFAATLFPWYARNKRVADTWTFTSTSSYVLFRQNAAQFYQSMTGEDTVTARKSFLKLAGIPGESVPRDTEYSAEMKKFAIKFILSHPFKYAVFHISTFIPFFTSSGANEYSRFVHDLLPDFDPKPEPSLLQAIHPFSLPTLIIVIRNHGWTLVENFFWLFVTIFAFLGLWFSTNKRLMRMFWAMILYFAVVTGPIAHARYRIPVEPLLLISAFGSASVLWSKYGDYVKRKLRISNAH